MNPVSSLVMLPCHSTSIMGFKFELKKYLLTSSQEKQEIYFTDSHDNKPYGTVHRLVCLLNNHVIKHVYCRAVTKIKTKSQEVLLITVQMLNFKNQEFPRTPSQSAKDTSFIGDRRAYSELMVRLGDLVDYWLREVSHWTVWSRQDNLPCLQTVT